MRYWRHVLSRAAQAAATDVRIGGASIAALLLGQIVLAVVLFLASGLTSANLPLRLTTALLPFLIFPAFFVFRIVSVPAAIDSERQARIAELERSIEDSKWAAIGGENARRHQLLSQFRELYKLSEDGLSPELVANLAWPPIEWLNNKLDRRGERRRIERIEAEKIYTRELEA